VLFRIFFAIDATSPFKAPIAAPETPPAIPLAPFRNLLYLHLNGCIADSRRQPSRLQIAPA